MLALIIFFLFSSCIVSGNILVLICLERACLSQMWKNSIKCVKQKILKEERRDVMKMDMKNKVTFNGKRISQRMIFLYIYG